MSNKSGTSSQVISLPQGGGALKGIGETFAPDLHTGTGNFTVPIALPPGRNGFQPELSLVYSTGSGNGPFGLGWGLSIPGVMRKTSKGIPRYEDERDTFVLSGAEDLVPVERTSELTRYRPRTEGLFARIEHHHDASSNYWKVWSKNGLVSYYGRDAILEGEANPATIANPDPLRRDNVFAWQLSRTEDPFGNRIEYEYERDIGENGPHPWDQLYLRRIRYVDFGDRENPQFLVSVTFEYADRPDSFSEYRSGFEIRTRRRCREIQVRTHADEERLVRTYRFVYLDQREDLEDLDRRLPMNGTSLLSQVRAIGHDGDLQERLPALEFDYTRFEPVGREFFPVEGRDLPSRSLASQDLELADLFGNGLPDILQMNGTVRYWRNLGNGRFDLPREMKAAPAGLTLADPGVQMIDADGDGRIDLLVTNEQLSGYFPLRLGGLWDRKSFQKYDLAPSFNLEGPEVQLVDLTGDGVTDAIRSGSRLECFFNDPQEGWTETRHVGRRDLEDFPNVNFADPRVKWGDMTGDGLQDIVLVHDGNIEYWPNLGYGSWGRRVSMRNSPRYAYGYDPRRILIGDIDGDGLDDIVYVDHCKVILWINQSGNGWSDPIEIKGTPPLSDVDAVRLVDLLGTGISGVLWTADVRELGRSNIYFLDFTGGVKPYLLNEMDNHMGSLTRVAYAPSVRFYLEDEREPETSWKTPLPFPVQVVSRVEAIDQISRGKLTTEYKYHHGYWDGAEREFRGFGRVEQCDTEIFEDYDRPGLHGGEREFERIDPEKNFSPPMLTKTWFHQGPVGDEFGEWEELDYGEEYWVEDRQVLERPLVVTEFLNGLPRRVKRDALRTLRGQILRTEVYALDGTELQDRPYTVTESVRGMREISPPTVDGAGRQRIFFPYAIAQRTTEWDRGEDPMTQFGFVDDYDAYGQPRKQVAIACARGWRNWTDERNDYLATYAETTFAQRDNERVYIVDRSATATSYEIRSGSAIAVELLRQAALAGTADLQLIGHTLNFYDGEAFAGLPNGRIDRYGALVRSEKLVLLESQLREAYGADIPPYLDPSGSPDWSTAEYPEPFREALVTSGATDPTRSGLTRLPTGHGFSPGEVGSPYRRGYYVATRNQFDFQTMARGRGLVQATRDPLGREAQIRYDAPYELLPVEAIDPVGLTTRAAYDYRVLQPYEVTDPNGNRQRFGFSPLSLPAWSAVMGKEGESVGDTDAVPGTRFEYDFLAFERAQQPISVRSIQRQHHVTETDVPLPQRDETIDTVEFSDGFGRLVQTRTQGEAIRFGEPVFGGGETVLPANQADGPGREVVGVENRDVDNPNVVVSGWQIYDNKGRVVEQYEPFHSRGWNFATPGEAERGQKVEMYYDSRGRAIRTVNPDGSQQQIVYGVPVVLDNPNEFQPTPWEAYTYDANDLAPISSRPDGSLALLGSRAPSEHHFTPSSALIDALGRTIETVERNGSNPDEAYRTRSTYDIRGNLLTVTDALRREAFRYVYDLTPRGEEDSSSQVLRIDNIDAGERRVVFNVVGNELERRDSKGAWILQAYDLLNRPTQLWARDGLSQRLTLREQSEYGDGGRPDQPAAERTANRALNRLGQPARMYDEAGRIAFEAYDYKGNGLEKVRQVISDEAILSVFPDRGDPDPDWNIQAFRIDWQTESDEVLDPQEFRTSATYDALNRVKQMRYPQDVTGERKQLRPQYNRAGALARIELDDDTYVERIAYNVKGQRVLIAYGNRVMTRYAYDPETFRLVRMRSERYNWSLAAGLTYRPTSLERPLQDFAYAYDLVGNILSITDRTPESGIRGNPDAGRFVDDPELMRLVSTGDALVRWFTYDSIYRLKTATGRECDRPPETTPWLDAPRCTDLTRTRGYTENYDYDKMGNMQRLHHNHGFGGGPFVREFDPFIREREIPWNNQLESVTIDGEAIRYLYDLNGNLLREGLSRHFEWDHSDRLKAFLTQPGDAEPSEHAHYLYDTSGQRVKKLVRKQSGQEVEVTVYIDGIFDYHHHVQGNTVRENVTLHVMDNQQRIALVRVGTAFPGDRSPAVSYHLSDHLGSSNVVISDDSEVINREEFTPYGETSFGSFDKKRYRFIGKEHNEESGLYYHGARYYLPWLGKWLSTDPIGLNSGLNLFIYSSNSPLRYVDTSGLSDNEANPNSQRNPATRSGQRASSGGSRPRARGIFSSVFAAILTVVASDPNDNPHTPQVDPAENVGAASPTEEGRRHGGGYRRPRDRPGTIPPRPTTTPPPDPRAIRARRRRGGTSYYNSNGIREPFYSYPAPEYDTSRTGGPPVDYGDSQRRIDSRGRQRTTEPAQRLRGNSRFSQSRLSRLANGLRGAFRIGGRAYAVFTAVLDVRQTYEEARELFTGEVRLHDRNLDDYQVGDEFDYTREYGGAGYLQIPFSETLRIRVEESDGEKYFRIIEQSLPNFNGGTA